MEHPAHVKHYKCGLQNFNEPVSRPKVTTIYPPPTFALMVQEFEGGAAISRRRRPELDTG